MIGPPTSSLQWYHYLAIFFFLFYVFLLRGWLDRREIRIREKIRAQDQENMDKFHNEKSQKQK